MGKSIKDKMLIDGIHHITAFAGDPQRNVDFYTGILGMRMIKKTVNFDDPKTYHLYYANEYGTPGTVLTFFPEEGMSKGSHGVGMQRTTSFSVHSSSLSYWENRLEKFKVQYKNPEKRFNDEVVLYFEDPDGLGLELIFNENDTRSGFTYGHIPLEFSIKGFYSAELLEESYELTAGLLTEQMNHFLIAEKGNRFRFGTSDSPGSYIDIVCADDLVRGVSGSGTIHHIAFNTPSDQTHEQVREKISQRRLRPTPVIDREYFKSIYFREPGGVLFEIATSGPGFTIDENFDELGSSLKLPPQHEHMRAELEEKLTPLKLNLEKFI